MRGLIKDKNNMAFFNRGEEIKIIGSFFEEYKELVYKFLDGYYPTDYTEYEEEKRGLLHEKKSKKLLSVLDFLEKNKNKSLTFRNTK